MTQAPFSHLEGKKRKRGPSPVLSSKKSKVEPHGYGGVTIRQEDVKAMKMEFLSDEDFLAIEAAAFAAGDVRRPQPAATTPPIAGIFNPLKRVSSKAQQVPQRTLLRLRRIDLSKEHDEVMLDAHGSYLKVWPRFFCKRDADRLLRQMCEESASFEQGHVRIHGMVRKEPRLAQWYGSFEYRYSGKVNPPRAPPDFLEEIRAAVNDAVFPGGEGSYDGALVNLYRDERDSIGKHRDKEDTLKRGSPIASVSLGCERRFVITNGYKTFTEKHEIRLPHGSLIVMGGPMQKHWYHEVPKEKSVCSPRINVTFRQYAHKKGR